MDLITRRSYWEKKVIGTREREEKCRKSNWKKCREKNAEATIGENHDREIELVRVRRRIKRNGGVI